MIYSLVYLDIFDRNDDVNESVEGCKDEQSQIKMVVEEETGNVESCREAIERIQHLEGDALYFITFIIMSRFSLSYLVRISVDRKKHTIKSRIDHCDTEE